MRKLSPPSIKQSIKLTLGAAAITAAAIPLFIYGFGVHSGPIKFTTGHEEITRQAIILFYDIARQLQEDKKANDLEIPNEVVEAIGTVSRGTDNRAEAFEGALNTPNPLINGNVAADKPDNPDWIKVYGTDVRALNAFPAAGNLLAYGDARAFHFTLNETPVSSTSGDPDILETFKYQTAKNSCQEATDKISYFTHLGVQEYRNYQSVKNLADLQNLLSKDLRNSEVVNEIKRLVVAEDLIPNSLATIGTGTQSSQELGKQIGTIKTKLLSRLKALKKQAEKDKIYVLDQKDLKGALVSYEKNPSRTEADATQLRNKINQAIEKEFSRVSKKIDGRNELSQTEIEQLKTDLLNKSLFRLGVATHTIQDSFSPSHTFRSPVGQITHSFKKNRVATTTNQTIEKENTTKAFKHIWDVAELADRGAVGSPADANAIFDKYYQNYNIIDVCFYDQNLSHIEDHLKEITLGNFLKIQYGKDRESDYTIVSPTERLGTFLLNQRPCAHGKLDKNDFIWLNSSNQALLLFSQTWWNVESRIWTKQAKMLKRIREANQTPVLDDAGLAEVSDHIKYTTELVPIMNEADRNAVNRAKASYASLCTDGGFVTDESLAFLCLKHEARLARQATTRFLMTVFDIIKGDGTATSHSTDRAAIQQKLKSYFFDGNLPADRNTSLYAMDKIMNEGTMKCEGLPNRVFFREHMSPAWTQKAQAQLDAKVKQELQSLIDNLTLGNQERAQFNETHAAEITNGKISKKSLFQIPENTVENYPHYLRRELDTMDNRFRME